MTTKRTLPEAFVASLDAYGVHAAPLVEALSCTDPSVAVRANVGKGARLAADTALSGGRVPWLDTGMYLDERPVFAADPAWHAGLYYVQDASSMAITAIARALIDRCLADVPLRALDACAAPGGKSIALYEALPQGSMLLSNEYDGRRAAVLCENVAKFGAPDILVSRGDTSVIAALDEAFDLILVDAPCSGEGMMRKEPVAITQWSPALVAQCADLQRSIVANCYAARRPGGVLIYSTCTFNHSEDEDILRHLVEDCGAEVLPLESAEYPGAVGAVVGDLPCLHFLPGAVRGEGLFVSAVRRPGEWQPAAEEGSVPTKQRRRTDRRNGKGAAQSADAFAADHLLDPEHFATREYDGNAVAVSKLHAEFADLLGRKLHLLRSGLPLYSTKGRDIVPAWELALSTALRPDSFPQLTLSSAEALRYLHGDSLTDIPDGLPRGYILVACDGTPLGFAKNIGRRANNLYPDGYRLRLDPASVDTSSLPHIVL